MLNVYAQNYKVPYLSIKRFFSSSTTNVEIKTSTNFTAAAYQPRLVERKKYENWEKYNLFTADEHSSKPRFSMVLPPPNVTGDLHLGHALACTIQDVVARHKRSMGLNVLWLPGTDHAGIATQGVVEKNLQSRQHVSRQEIGRERFVKEVWKWKDKHGNNIHRQLRTLGCSLDWSRHVFTMDPKHTQAVNAAFIELFKKGLIYRKRALVNWCNTLKSTVSDIEVENICLSGEKDLPVPGYDEAQKFGMMYYFAYKLCDSNTDEEIVVGTTMPETLMGDTAIAVHPDDERYRHLKYRRAKHPFKDTTIPIIFDDFVDMDFGTGAVKITPAHSKIDYEIAELHNLPAIEVINDEGRMINSDKFNKMKIFDARQEIVNCLSELDLLRDVKPHHMVLPICSRTGDVITYLPREQWFLSCSQLNERVAALVESDHVEVVPERFIKQWIDWTKDDRDWCISRQLWWGHQIPAYKCSVDGSFVWVAATSEKDARKEASKYLRTLPDLIETEKEKDVLDTWFSSGIYPFASLGWPSSYHHKDYCQFYPLNLLATGHDILGFWVHRMAMLGLELTGQIPFNKVLLHGVICDGKGQKMSKSKGNVIDPMDVVNGISLKGLKEKSVEMYRNGILSEKELGKALQYHKANFSATNGIPECGVDALRFTLLSQNIKSQYVNFDVGLCHANKLFCNKIWQSIKYTQMAYAKLNILENEITPNDLTLFDKWILSRLSNMVDNVNTSMESYDFHIATKALRTLIYNEFCDIYLEATKPGFADKDIKKGYAHAHTLSAVLNTSLRCLSPFMVYLTDELIHQIPSFSNNIIYNFKDSTHTYLDFPQPGDFNKWKDGSLERQMGKILNTVNLIREVKGLYNISNKIKPTVFLKTSDSTLTSDVKANKPVVLKLTRCSDIVFKEKTNTHYVSAALDKDTAVNVELTGQDAELTVAKAKSRLEKRIKKLEDSLSKLEAKFESRYYVTNVPEWVQIVDREKLTMKKLELEALQRLM